MEENGNVDDWTSSIWMGVDDENFPKRVDRVRSAKPSEEGRARSYRTKKPTRIHSTGEHNSEPAG